MPILLCRCGTSARFIQLHQYLDDSPNVFLIPAHVIQCAECRRTLVWDNEIGGWRIFSLLDDRDGVVYSNTP